MEASVCEERRVRLVQRGAQEVHPSSGGGTKGTEKFKHIGLESQIAVD